MIERTYTIFVTVTGDDSDALDAWVQSGRWVDPTGRQGTPELHHKGSAEFQAWETGGYIDYDENGDEIANTTCD